MKMRKFVLVAAALVLSLFGLQGCATTGNGGYGTLGVGATVEGPLGNNNDSYYRQQPVYYGQQPVYYGQRTGVVGYSRDPDGAPRTHYNVGR